MSAGHSCSVASVAPPASAPRVVGRYTIHDEIAAGGLGSVHFARLMGPSGFARTVVAKLAHWYLVRLPEVALMLSDEARLAARIHHANVVPTLDVIRAPDELILVMEYVHGDSLAQVASAAAERGERIPLEIATAIVVDALHGLHAAHEATDERGLSLGIVHRDVSPQNILVGADGVSRLVDFGVALATGRAQETTSTRNLKGKHGYMAPEQLCGGQVTRRTDTFAAAVVYWELLTGESLFLGRTEAETIRRCLEAPVQPPSRLVPGIPRAIDEILLRALSRDPADRYPTALAMALEVESCVRPVRATEIGSWVECMVPETLAHRRAVLARIECGEAEAKSALESSGERVSFDEATVVRASRISPAMSQTIRTATAPPTLRGAPLPNWDDDTRPQRTLAWMKGHFRRFAFASGIAIALVCAASIFLCQRIGRCATAAGAPAAPTLPATSSRAPATTVPATQVPPRAGEADSCVPPYTVDSLGHPVFKFECL